VEGQDVGSGSSHPEHEETDIEQHRQHPAWWPGKNKAQVPSGAKLQASVANPAIASSVPALTNGQPLARISPNSSSHWSGGIGKAPAWPHHVRDPRRSDVAVIACHLMQEFWPGQGPRRT
jgi:hypothetical protein